MVDLWWGSGRRLQCLEACAGLPISPGDSILVESAALRLFPIPIPGFSSPDIANGERRGSRARHFPATRESAANCREKPAPARGRARSPRLQLSCLERARPAVACSRHGSGAETKIRDSVWPLPARRTAKNAGSRAGSTNFSAPGSPAEASPPRAQARAASPAAASSQRPAGPGSPPPEVEHRDPSLLAAGRAARAARRPSMLQIRAALTEFPSNSRLPDFWHDITGQREQQSSKHGSSWLWADPPLPQPLPAHPPASSLSTAPHQHCPNVHARASWPWPARRSPHHGTSSAWSAGESATARLRCPAPRSGWAAVARRQQLRFRHAQKLARWRAIAGGLGALALRGQTAAFMHMQRPRCRIGAEDGRAGQLRARPRSQICRRPAPHPSSAACLDLMALAIEQRYASSPGQGTPAALRRPAQRHGR